MNLKEIEAIAGFRTWLVRGDRLISFGDTLWEPGEEMVARHNLPLDALTLKETGCPHTDGACGFNGYYDFETFAVHGLWGSVSDIAGIISPRGETILCENGFRSERCAVEAFIATNTEIGALGAKFDLRPRLEELARIYGVPLLEPEEVQGFCDLEGLEILPVQTGESEIEESRSYSSGLIPGYVPAPPAGYNAFSIGYPGQGPSGIRVSNNRIMAPKPKTTRFQRFIRGMQFWRSTWPL